jgi:hypothetical protein
MEVDRTVTRPQAAGNLVNVPFSASASKRVLLKRKDGEGASAKKRQRDDKLLTSR